MPPPRLVASLLSGLLALGGLALADAVPTGASEQRQAGPGAGAVCGPLFELRRPGGQVTCTHGPDLASEVAAPRSDHSRSEHSRSEHHGEDAGTLPTHKGDVPTDVAPGVFCEGDGREGNRVQAVYAFSEGTPDHYAEVAPQIGRWAADVDAVFQASARRTGGVRRVRWVTTPSSGAGCRLDVLRLEMAPQAERTFDATVAELHHRGLMAPDRKYLVWVDSDRICGQSEMWPDDRPDGLNLSNGQPHIPATVSRIDRPCWGQAEHGRSVEAHELMHALGGVQASAPHATASGHCRDDADRMCRPDGNTLVTEAVCPVGEESLFDCGGDDYFNVHPPGGSYLDRHWNTADSSFLTAAHPAVFVTDASTTEQPGGADLAFTVTAATDPPEPVDIYVSVRDGSAAAGSDFLAPPRTVHLDTGRPSTTLHVTVLDDGRREDPEAFTLTLSAPVNATLSRREAVGTILDDEPADSGYTLVGADAGAFAFGDASFLGRPPLPPDGPPVVAAAPAPSRAGYWLARKDGIVFPVGDAPELGSTPKARPGRSVVGLATFPRGIGYWLAWDDGKVEPFGEAPDLGSAPRRPSPVVAMAASPALPGTGTGYWLARRDGTVLAFGQAPPAGSARAPAERPVVAIAAARSGYWLALRDGTVIPFGGAEAPGPAPPMVAPAVALIPTPSGSGCWLVAADGGVFACGDARFFGSAGRLALNRPVTAALAR